MRPIDLVANTNYIPFRQNDEFLAASSPSLKSKLADKYYSRASDKTERHKKR